MEQIKPGYKVKSLKEVPKIVSKEKEIRAVLFDLGDTLLSHNYFEKWEEERDRKLWGLCEKNCRRFDIDLSEYMFEKEVFVRRMNKQRHKSFKEIKFTDFVNKFVKKICLSAPKGFTKKYYNLYMKYALASYKSMPYTQEILKELSRKKYKLGVITNTWHSRDFVNKVLKKLKIKKYFDVLIVSSEEGTFKPNPGLFAKALKRVKVVPKNAIFVGNELEADIYGAEGACLKTIQVINKNGGKNNG